MAGGLGQRLGAISKHKPKPAIIVGGKPFILHKLDYLISVGFKKFFFIVSYKKDLLKKVIVPYLENQNIVYEFFSEKHRVGTFNALFSINNKLPNHFFYTNADEILNYNILSMYNKFLNENFDVVSLLKQSCKGNIIIDNNNIKKFEENGTHIELGCKFIKKEIFNYINRPYEKIEEFIYREITNKLKVGYYLSNSLPLRIDTPSDIRNFNLLFNSQ